MPAPSIASIAGFERSLVVGVGGLVVSNDQSATLTTYSLGSCLGVTVYDPVTRAGGLLHAMLPDSTINPKKAAVQPGMFVDTGIPALFRASYQLRAEKQRMQVCVAGGAQFLDPTGFFNIGLRNFTCLKELLRKNGVNLLAEEIGGTVSRTIHLKLATGEVRLKTSGQTSEAVIFRG
jgi:chemotaxis protein CheD